MPRRIKLTLEYDGTDFKGFQVQDGQDAGAGAHAVRTVQGEVEQALKIIAGQSIRIAGASRTDAGVHAMGQVACFTLPDEALISTAEICQALNAHIKKDVSALRAEEVDANFHAQRDAHGKIYSYSMIMRRERPSILRRTHWHVRFPLNIERMQRAAAQLVGEHDFSSFATKLKDTQEKRADEGKAALGTVREIRRLEVNEDAAFPGRVVMTIEGSGFLYQMVRTIAGSLVDVGRGFRTIEWLGEALAARDRRAAGPTAPPHGLCLEKVLY
jgi:tRNA pseudouridine38-40 synthase